MSEPQETTEDRQRDALVILARTNRDSFGQLYDEIYRPVFRYCVRRMGNRSLGEDVTSMVFLQVAKNIGKFSGETYLDFRRWVFFIATNVMNAHDRQTMRRQSLLLEAAESGQLPSSDHVNGQPASNELDQIQACMTQLSERDRTIITLRFFSELPYDDIGQILDISSEAARTAASRAIKKLRRKVGRR